MPSRLELMMMSNIYIFVFCFTAYFPIATTETVWLKYVTTRLQRDKRSIDDPDLPEKLSFLLKRNSDTLTLNLKRNYHVDPNADIYTVRNLKDGQSILEKTVDVEKDDMAYYQDRENGAFMAARCVKRSNGQCDILISGNIKIGDRNYDLQPSKDDFATRNVLENTDLLAKRYVLQDQSNIERDIPYIQQLSNIEIDMPVQHDQLYIERDQEFQQDEANNERYMVVERKDNVKTVYTVKVVVVPDSSVWDLFLELANNSLSSTERISEASMNMRRYFSYIINGVDQLYTGINDPNFEIHVKIRHFLVFQAQAHFPHQFSQVESVNGTSFINARYYLADLCQWDLSGALKHVPDYDQVILFTRYKLHLGDMRIRKTGGLSYPGKVCVPGYRVELVHSTDYFRTTSIAAHELGHSLGAVHDGDDTATACKAEDGFIMAPTVANLDPDKAYSNNPWKFSKCSVEAFQRTLVTKADLTKKFVYTPAQSAFFNMYMAEPPGQYYTPNMQCQLFVGPGSVQYGALPGNRCRFMRCTHPTSKTRLKKKYYSAAPGTTCGANMVQKLINQMTVRSNIHEWCQQGLCVKIHHT